jgi:hypothetical protein
MRMLREALQELPKSFEDSPQAELWSLCLSFIKAVDEYTQAKWGRGGTECSFIQQSEPHYLEFQADILRTRPKFQVSARNECGAPTPEEKPRDQEGIPHRAFG